MTQPWIECNLSWSVDRPPYEKPSPELKAEIKAQFGVTLASLEKALETLEKELGVDSFKVVWDLMDKHQPKLNKMPVGSVKRRRLLAAEWRKQPGQEEISNTWLKIEEIKQWKEQHPKTKAWSKAYVAHAKKAPPDSFCARGLNKPGTRIETTDGTIYWIGDINTNKGVCDDCTAFEDDTIIVRYQEPPHEEE